MVFSLVNKWPSVCPVSHFPFWRPEGRDLKLGGGVWEGDAGRNNLDQSVPFPVYLNRVLGSFGCLLQCSLDTEIPKEPNVNSV